jgi:hypothetical protein
MSAMSAGPLKGLRLGSSVHRTNHIQILPLKGTRQPAIPKNLLGQHHCTSVCCTWEAICAYVQQYHRRSQKVQHDRQNVATHQYQLR